VYIVSSWCVISQEYAREKSVGLENFDQNFVCHRCRATRQVFLHVEGLLTFLELRSIKFTDTKRRTPTAERKQEKDIDQENTKTKSTQRTKTEQKKEE